MTPFRWLFTHRRIVAKPMEFSLATSARDHIFLVGFIVTVDASIWIILWLVDILPRHRFFLVRLLVL